MLGLNSEAAQKAISAAVPAILASFAGVASNPIGEQRLSNALAQSADTVDALKNAGQSSQRLAETGSGLLSTLLGGSTSSTLADTVSKFAGIDQGAGRSLLGMLAPVILGGLGQQQRESGLSPDGMASLLASQKSSIASAMPAGFGDMLKRTGLLDSVGGAMNAGAKAASTAASTSTAAATQAAAAAQRATPSGLPFGLAGLAGLAVLAGLAWYFLGDRSDEQVAQKEPDRTVGAATTNPSAADLRGELLSSVSSARVALQGITDPASARAAMPKLQQAVSELDRINTVAQQLPPGARTALGSTIAPSMAMINQLCDKVLATPELAEIAKPTIDAMRAKLVTLSRA
jgi:hypothetical protein